MRFEQKACIWTRATVGFVPDATRRIEKSYLDNNDGSTRLSVYFLKHQAEGAKANAALAGVKFVVGVAALFIPGGEPLGAVFIISAFANLVGAGRRLANMDIINSINSKSQA